MTANPVRPARHRANKPSGPVRSSSESESESEADESTKPKKHTIPPPPKVSTGAGRIVTGLGKVDLSDQRQRQQQQQAALAAEEAEKKRLRALQRALIEKKAEEEGFVTEEEGGSKDEESGEESEESSEEESSSEEEAPRRLMARPVFIPKAQREAMAAAKAAAEIRTRVSPPPGAATDGAADDDKLDPETRRQRAADALVEEQIRKHVAERSRTKGHWESDGSGGRSGSDSGSDVDTTDGLDPEAEQAAWRLRELKRLRRERLAIEARERELAELERIRNLPEAERRALDEERLARQREEKASRGKVAFMQKYYHKGAFFQDQLKETGLANRDIMGARFADEARNRELLPKALQVRDATKIGRKGATKYRDLRSEDTGVWGQGIRDERRGGDRKREWDRYIDDDRFRPDSAGRHDREGRGANAIPVDEKRRRL